MGLRTQTLKGMHGGLNTVAQDLEGLEGPTQSPDLLNCFALPGTVYSRLGSAPWWDTGGTGPLYWFSFFKPLSVGGDDNVRPGTDLSDSETPVNESGATIDAGGWHWPTITRTPPRPRVTNTAFKILTPVNGTLNVDPAAGLHITWQRRKGALGYKIQVKDLDTGVEAMSYPDCPATGYTVPADTFARSKEYVVKVWAILAKTPQGAPTQLERATNTPTFTTKLSVPTNLAPVGTINTLTPTFTCDDVPKAKRYKVKIYAADSVTVLHTSMALLLPSYPLGAGVLTDYTTKYWSYTAYPDAVCTADYGVESGHEILYQIALDDTLADGAVGTAYTGTVTATGGTGPYTYAVTSGTLPAGLTLASNGGISGTPTTAETATFTITATDANGNTGSRAYSVTVGVWEAVTSGFNPHYQSVDIHTATGGMYKLTHTNAFQRYNGGDGVNVYADGSQTIIAGSPTLPLLPAGAPGTLTLPAVTYGVALYRLDAGSWTAAGLSVIFTATNGQVIKVKDNVNDADNMPEYNNHVFTLYKLT